MNMSICWSCKHPKAIHYGSGCEYEHDGVVCRCVHTRDEFNRYYSLVSDMKIVALWWFFIIAMSLITIGIASIVDKFI